MIDLTFYEKPGCLNNTKQKALLASAGYRVAAFNLLEHAWTRTKPAAVFRHAAGGAMVQPQRAADQERRGSARGHGRGRRATRHAHRSAIDPPPADPLRRPLRSGLRRRNRVLVGRLLPRGRPGNLPQGIRGFGVRVAVGVQKRLTTGRTGKSMNSSLARQYPGLVPVSAGDLHSYLPRAPRGYGSVSNLT